MPNFGIRNDISGNFIAITSGTEDVVIFDTSGVSKGSGRRLAQLQTFHTGAYASGSTVIPWDISIPQSNEGDQYMSLSITPTNALSTLEIDVSGAFTSSNVNTISTALFQDSLANALAANQETISSIGGVADVSLKHIMVAGTTSLITFKVRAGLSSAGTLYLNGTGGVTVFAGVMASRITIKEWLP